MKLVHHVCQVEWETKQGGTKLKGLKKRCREHHPFYIDPTDQEEVAKMEIELSYPDPVAAATISTLHPVGPKGTCSWSLTNAQCNLLILNLEPRSVEGCSNYVHQPCQMEWEESMGNAADPGTKQCPNHHPCCNNKPNEATNLLTTSALKTPSRATELGLQALKKNSPSRWAQTSLLNKHSRKPPSPSLTYLNPAVVLPLPLHLPLANHPIRL